MVYINACIHPGLGSRTKELAEYYLMKRGKEYKTVDISDGRLCGITSEALEKRNTLIVNGDFSDSMFDMAKQFSSASEIVIAAPYWDLSFPAVVKAYLEHVFVPGITFTYEDDRPVGLCSAEKLVFITTAGGYIGDNNFSGDYIKAASEFFGIGEYVQYSAEGLDIIGNDPKEIMEKAKSAMD